MALLRGGRGDEGQCASGLREGYVGEALASCLRDSRHSRYAPRGVRPVVSSRLPPDSGKAAASDGGVRRAAVGADNAGASEVVEVTKAEADAFDSQQQAVRSPEEEQAEAETVNNAAAVDAPKLVGPERSYSLWLEPSEGGRAAKRLAELQDRLRRAAAKSYPSVSASTPPHVPLVRSLVDLEEEEAKRRVGVLAGRLWGGGSDDGLVVGDENATSSRPVLRLRLRGTVEVAGAWEACLRAGLEVEGSSELGELRARIRSGLPDSARGANEEDGLVLLAGNLPRGAKEGLREYAEKESVTWLKGFDIGEAGARLALWDTTGGLHAMPGWRRVASFPL